MINRNNSDPTKDITIIDNMIECGEEIICNPMSADRNDTNWYAEKCNAVLKDYRDLKVRNAQLVAAYDDANRKAERAEDAHRRISALPNCNDCMDSRTCRVCSKWGSYVRYNCHLWRGPAGQEK